MSKKVPNKGIATKEMRQERVGICASCEFNYQGKLCEKCRCDLSAKIRRYKSKCPINKW